MLKKKTIVTSSLNETTKTKTKFQTAYYGMLVLILKCSLFQNWEYPRKNLVYLKELGEGEFGKVLLMKAQVNIIIWT